MKLLIIKIYKYNKNKKRLIKFKNLQKKLLKIRYLMNKYYIKIKVKTTILKEENLQFQNKFNLYRIKILQYQLLIKLKLMKRNI